MEGDISQGLFNLVGIGVVFYGVLVASLLLFSKSPHKFANRMLAIIMLIGIWYITAAILVLTGNFVHIASFFRIGLPSFYAIPPLIFWYVQARIDKSFRIKPLAYLHLLPVLLTIIDSIPFHLQSAEEKVQIVQTMSNDLRNILKVRTGLIPDYLHFFIRPVHGVIYTTLAAIYLRKVLADKKQRKEIECQKNLKTWFILFISFFTLIYIGLFITNFIWIGLPYPLKELSRISLIPSSICVGIFLAIHIFIFFNLSSIFGKETVSKPKPQPTPSVQPEEKLPEETPKNDKVLTEIDKFIIENEIFKNPKITAPEIASMIGIPPHTFSSILNNQYGKRFPDFINTYRINFVIAELDKGTNGNMSIEGIATEAGFASRSAFYNSFKKITGLTPSEYIKNQN